MSGSVGRSPSNALSFNAKTSNNRASWRTISRSANTAASPSDDAGKGPSLNPSFDENRGKIRWLPPFLATSTRSGRCQNPTGRTFETLPPGSDPLIWSVGRLQRAAQLRQRLFEVLEHRFDLAALVQVEHGGARRRGRWLRAGARQRLAPPAGHRLRTGRYQ